VNQEIREATKGGIAAIWGSLIVDPDQKHEDGRLRKYNAALVAQGGALLENGLMRAAVKTLLPRYRIFDDARHFTSTRQLVEESRENVRRGREDTSGELDLHSVLRPFPIRLFAGNRPAEGSGWPPLV